MDVAGSYKREEYGEGVLAFVVAIGWNRGAGCNYPRAETWFVPARLPFDKLRKSYPALIAGFFCSHQEAEEYAAGISWNHDGIDIPECDKVKEGHHG